MPGIYHANGVLSVHLAPDQLVVALSIEFADQLKTPEIEARVHELEGRLQEIHPSVVALFVKPQTASGFREHILRRYGAA